MGRGKMVRGKGERRGNMEKGEGGGRRGGGRGDREKWKGGRRGDEMILLNSIIFTLVALMLHYICLRYGERDKREGEGRREMECTLYFV
jgi:hypothetical protein